MGSSHVIGPDKGDPSWVVDDILLGQLTTGGSSSKKEKSSKKGDFGGLFLSFKKKGEFSPHLLLMQNIF